MDIEVRKGGMMLMCLEDTGVLVTKSATDIVELSRAAATGVVDAVATVKRTEAMGWGVLAGPLARRIHLGMEHGRAVFPSAQYFLRVVGGKTERVVLVLLEHSTARLCRDMCSVVLHHIVLS